MALNVYISKYWLMHIFFGIYINMGKLKYILKNKDEFLNIRLSRGISLLGKEFVARNNYKEFSGTSIKRFGDKWFVLQKGKALFKTFDGEYKAELKEIRIINELICQELASMVGILHADYEPASYEEHSGLVTYNFLQNNEKLITLADFLSIDNEYENNLLDIKHALKTYEQVGYILDFDEIIFNLFKILVFDALTLQTDRNNFNINFIINQRTHTLALAPMFDNEFAFSSDFMLELDPKTTIEAMLKHYSKEAKYINVQSERIGHEETYIKNVRSLCNMAKCNKQMKEFLITTLKKLNILTAIKNVENMGIYINEEYKLYLKSIISHTKLLMAKELAKEPDEDTIYLYEELFK